MAPTRTTSGDCEAASAFTAGASAVCAGVERPYKAPVKSSKQRAILLMSFWRGPLTCLCAKRGNSFRPGCPSDKDLEAYVYYFDIENSKLRGDGAKFLVHEIGRSQSILLGEYHNSLRISELTQGEHGLR
jgi:hypothetical protein